MHSIVVATDFSEVANNAVHFACRMAADYRVSVTILHAYIVPVAFTDNPMPVMPVDDSREIAQENLDKLVSSLRLSYPAQEINTHLTYGDIKDSLEEYAEKNNPWLIIIGNSAEGQDTLWFGSNVTSTLKSLPYRTMAVPANTTYKKPAKICLACNYKNVDEHFPAADLMDIISNVQAELHILNVGNDGLEAPAEAGVLQNMLGSANPQYHYVSNEQIDEGVQSFVENNHIDWLVVIPHKYSFWDNLFHKSHTSAMARMVHIPIIALHETKNG